MKKYIDDILSVIGLLIITATTFTIDLKLGSYVLGVVFIVAGIFFAKLPSQRGDKN